MSLTASKDGWRAKMTILTIALCSRLQGRLTGMLPQYFIELSKHQPLWLEADDDLKMRIKAAHALNHKSDTSYYRLKVYYSHP